MQDTSIECPVCYDKIYEFTDIKLILCSKIEEFRLFKCDNCGTDIYKSKNKYIKIKPTCVIKEYNEFN